MTTATTSEADIYEIDLGGFSSSSESDSGGTHGVLSTGTRSTRDDVSLSASSRGSSRTASMGASTAASTSLASSLYDPSVGSGAPITRKSKLDFANSEFDSKAYVEKQCAELTVNELVTLNNTLSKDIKALDSEMQMMVYDNYTKFISATDTIREMKGKVESMESEMSRLLESMSDIEEGCQRLEDKLEPNRNEMEKLVSVRSLLKRLKFLFELPDRLKASIKIKAFSQAVKYYLMATHILAKYEDIESFAVIKRQSDAIMEELTKDLNYQLVQSTTALRSQLQYAQLLLDLGKHPSHLWYDIFFARKSAFLSAMNELMKSDKLASYYAVVSASEKQRRKSGSGSVSPKGVDKDKSTDGMDVDENDMDKKTEETSLQSPTGTGTLEFFSVVEFFRVGFIQDFVSFSDQFSRIFLPKKGSGAMSRGTTSRRHGHGRGRGHGHHRAHHGKHHRSSSRRKHRSSYGSGDIDSALDGGSRENSEDKAMAALTDFTRTVFDKYFACIKECLLKECSIDKLTEELQAFYDGLYKPSEMVPNAKLRDRGTEIIEACIRACMSLEFRLTQRRNVEYFSEFIAEKKRRKEQMAISESDLDTLSTLDRAKVSRIDKAATDSCPPGIGGHVAAVGLSRDRATDISRVIDGSEDDGGSIEGEVKACVSQMTANIKQCLDRLVPLTTNQSTLVPILDLNFDDQLWVYTCALFEDLGVLLVPFEYVTGMDPSGGSGSNVSGIYKPRLLKMPMDTISGSGKKMKGSTQMPAFCVSSSELRLEIATPVSTTTAASGGSGVRKLATISSSVDEDDADALAYSTLSASLKPVISKLSDFGLLFLSKVFLRIAESSVAQITMHFRKNFLSSYYGSRKRTSVARGSKALSPMTVYKREEARLCKICNDCAAGLRLMYAEKWADKIVAGLKESEFKSETDTFEALDLEHSQETAVDASSSKALAEESEDLCVVTEADSSAVGSVTAAECETASGSVNGGLSADQYSDGALAMATCIRLIVDELCEVYQVSAFEREWHEVQCSIGECTSKQRDIDRFFSDKPPVMARVRDNGASVMFSVFKIALKNWSETLRTLRIHPRHLKRVERDLDLIRSRIPKLIDSKESQSLDLFFDEIHLSAQNRTTE